MMESKSSRIRSGALFSPCIDMYLAVDGAGLQQPIAKIEAKQIMHWYQRLIYANERASEASPQDCEMPQIWPYFAACASLRCGRP
jgi:hypothetical protein